MPGFIARKLCPTLTIVPLNFSEYERLSVIVDTVLKKYNAHFDKVICGNIYKLHLLTYHNYIINESYCNIKYDDTLLTLKAFAFCFL